MNKRVKVVAVASGGGHWEQLILLRSVLDSYNTLYVTTLEELPVQAGFEMYRVVSDSNAEKKKLALLTFFQVALIILKFKPSCVVTTGALPGAAAVFWGKVMGAKTLWIDSMANARALSRGGIISKCISDVTLSQWESVADKEGVEFKGSVF